MNQVDFNELKGQVITSFEGKPGDEKIVIKTQSGNVYKMYHDQRCCETVVLENIQGDLSDIIGWELIDAREVSNHDIKEICGLEVPPAKNDNNYVPDSFTWTFYTLSTIHGRITIRWYGFSNGYYSESVSFYRV